MRILRLALLASVLGACGGPPKGVVPVDSPLRPWTPGPEAEASLEVETSTQAPEPLEPAK